MTSLYTCKPSEKATNHVEFVMLVKERAHGKSDDAAGGQGVVGVEDGSGLVVAGSQGAVEAGPEQPQEQGAWRWERGFAYKNHCYIIVLILYF